MGGLGGCFVGDVSCDDVQVKYEELTSKTAEPDVSERSGYQLAEDRAERARINVHVLDGAPLD